MFKTSFKPAPGEQLIPEHIMRQLTQQPLRYLQFDECGSTQRHATRASWCLGFATGVLLTGILCFSAAALAALYLWQHYPACLG